MALRLFIAIELSAPIRAAIGHAMDTLQQATPRHAIRWVPSENLHLTLKFLGDTPETQVEAIRQALGKAVEGQQAITLRVEGNGCFPNIRRPRVIWLGLNDSANRLVPLQTAIEAAIAPLGFPTDQRPFSPHLTLGRVKDHTPVEMLTQIGHGIQNKPMGLITTWPCQAVSLMKSDLRPSGAVYTQLAHYTFNS
ncbi:MAG: RNA 2',3'-cyclic phosphodiesterase [Anaerolineales bacterium]|nr:RNA 2',3'-cyclic phosphodiesterase [Anaerolineales bacterium]